MIEKSFWTSDTYRWDVKSVINLAYYHSYWHLCYLQSCKEYHYKIPFPNLLFLKYQKFELWKICLLQWNNILPLNNLVPRLTAQRHNIAAFSLMTLSVTGLIATFGKTLITVSVIMLSVIMRCGIIWMSLWGVSFCWLSWRRLWEVYSCLSSTF